GAVYDLLYDDTLKPVIDDWTPREAWVEAFEERRRQLLAEATEMDSYYAEGATRNRKQADRCTALLRDLGGAA
ncbi:hypothetical protein B7P34_36470, partial [Streptosporangium nondiastaticum]